MGLTKPGFSFGSVAGVAEGVGPAKPRPSFCGVGLGLEEVVKAFALVVEPSRGPGAVCICFASRVRMVNTGSLAALALSLTKSTSSANPFYLVAHRKSPYYLIHVIRGDLVERTL